ncbi:uncharacterized protein [Primulina huaijiensis]|uniref:uncharacterized protein n=1 Tax=Primulina huaijiensis TaxID=1492673 RepID=UPI003CC75D61
MVHLPVHLAKEAIIGGPVPYRWMYPIERMLFELKQLIRNMARPEGSIAEGYIAKECMTLCSRYLKDIETKFSRLERNYDSGFHKFKGEISIFLQCGRALGAGISHILDDDAWEKAHIYILKNCDEVQPFLEEYSKNEKNNTPQLSDDEWNSNFICWFKQQVDKMKIQDQHTKYDDLLSLCRGPSMYVTCFSGYVVNGYRFRIEARDKGCRTQNSGMKPMLAKSSVGNIRKPVKFLSPGKLAKERGYGHKTRPVGDSIGSASAHKSIGGIQRLQVEEQEAQYIGNQRRIGGISAHTIIVHFGEEEWKERDFIDDSSFLEILNICKKFIDIYFVGFKVTDGDGKPLRNDKDLLAMLNEHEYVDNIDIYVDVDETAQPLLFKLPEDNQTSDYIPIPRVPKVRDTTILGDYKTNEKVIVRGDVVNGSEQASTIQWFITLSKNFDIETGLQSISECTINKDFRIPIEAVGHYLVAKFTPMTEDGESGESSYAVTEKYVDDSATQKARKVRGKNKNKKIAALKSGEKMEIEFYNNCAVGKNHRYWSRHLGKIVRDKHICPIQVKTWKDLTELDKQHMWDSVKGDKDNNPPDIAKIFYETRHKNGKLVEPEAQEKYDEIVKTVQSNASLSHIEVVEKCFGPQCHSHVFGFGGGMKRKHFNCSQAAYVKDLEAKLHEKEEENNNLKRRMDGIESRLAKIENDNQATSDAPTMSGEDDTLS